MFLDVIFRSATTFEWKWDPVGTSRAEQPAFCCWLDVLAGLACRAPAGLANRVLSVHKLIESHIRGNKD